MKETVFPAHIRTEPDGSRKVQTVEEHCRKVAEYASKNLGCVGLGKTAYLAGILHDAGKYTDRFRSYITDAAEGKPVMRGSVNHTFAGVRYVQTELAGKGSENSAVRVITADLVSYAAGAHHGQFDCVDEYGKNGFEYRIRKNDIGYDEAMDNFQARCLGRSELEAGFRDACTEVQAMVVRISGIMRNRDAGKKREELYYYLGLAARLVQSAVIEGDRRDTAEFMQDAEFPAYPDDLREIWSRELRYAEEKMSELDHTSTVNRARDRISALCREKAESKGGLFRLNVPTGSGKTLSSLRFALAHAKKWDKKHIIIAAPLLSIVEQNAAVIREYIEDQNLILEHHSDVVQPHAEGDELKLSELYVESWEAPIIITTLVQLLNTMFSGETSCIRRFHSLCNAVIVIDEVQSLPAYLYTMFNLMISFLCQCCGTTVVLCSATQPCLEACSYPIEVEAEDLVPYDREIWEAFHRVDIVNMKSCREAALPERILEIAREGGSLLVICNKKSECEKVYRELSGRCSFPCYHLSAAMCMEHRRKVLSEIREQLKNGQPEEPLICVSTQVMEAGVDISFHRVVRLLAGMDNVVQAAGRCNRNGESREPGKVYMLNCTDENLGYLPEIRRGKTASVSLIHSGEYEEDYSSEEAIRQYYKNLYHEMDEGYQEYAIKGRKDTVFSLMAGNGSHVSAEEKKDPHRQHMLNQAFQEAGEHFHVFDDETVEVIVPYGKGKELIQELTSDSGYGHGKLRMLLQQAKGYTVTVYPYQAEKLEKAGAIRTLEELNVRFLADEFYDEETGVITPA